MMRRGWPVLISGVIVQMTRFYHTSRMVISLQSPIDHPFQLMMVLYWIRTFFSFVSCLWIYIFYFHVESLCFVRSLTNYIGLKLLINYISYTIYSGKIWLEDIGAEEGHTKFSQDWHFTWWKMNGKRDYEGCVPICTVTYRTPQVIIVVTDLCSSVTCLLTLICTSCCYMYQVQYTGTVITDFFLWCYIWYFGNNVYCSPECLWCLNNNPIGIDIEIALASWKFFPLEISNNNSAKCPPIEMNYNVLGNTIICWTNIFI